MKYLLMTAAIGVTFTVHPQSIAVQRLNGNNTSIVGQRMGLNAAPEPFKNALVAPTPNALGGIADKGGIQYKPLQGAITAPAPVGSQEWALKQQAEARARAQMIERVNAQIAYDQAELRAKVYQSNNLWKAQQAAPKQ